MTYPAKLDVQIWSGTSSTPYFVFSSSEGPGESAHVRKLFWAFAARCSDYRSPYKHCNNKAAQFLAMSFYQKGLLWKLLWLNDTKRFLISDCLRAVWSGISLCEVKLFPLWLVTDWWWLSFVCFFTLSNFLSGSCLSAQDMMAFSWATTRENLTLLL